MALFEVSAFDGLHMLPDGKNGLINLQFEDLCNSDCSVRARLVQSLEHVRIMTPTW